MFRHIFTVLTVLAVTSNAFTIPEPFDVNARSQNVQEVLPHIVGGVAATAGLLPFQAALRTPAGLFFCGGVIISNRWVVSAAHCTINRLVISMRVVVGTINWRTGVEHSPSRIANHPSYNAADIANDISLVQTTNTIIFNNVVSTLAMSSAFIGGGQNGVVSGWGALQGGGNPSDNLMFLHTTTITNADCRSRFTAAGENRAAQILFDHKMCTFTRQGQGFCQGDSGGPLMVNGQLVGIVSWNIPCAMGVPDVYDRISSHRAWITSISGI